MNPSSNRRARASAARLHAIVWIGGVAWPRHVRAAAISSSVFSAERDASCAEAQYADIVTVRPLGPTLAKSVINEAGDSIFIPPDVPHQPFNSSESEPAQAIVARNDANEQAREVRYDPGAPR